MTQQIKMLHKSTTQSNTVQKNYVLEKQVHSSATTIREYDRAPLKTLGEIDLPVTNPTSSKVMDVTSAIVTTKI